MSLSSPPVTTAVPRPLMSLALMKVLSRAPPVVLAAVAAEGVTAVGTTAAVEVGDLVAVGMGLEVVGMAVEVADMEVEDMVVVGVAMEEEAVVETATAVVSRVIWQGNAQEVVAEEEAVGGTAEAAAVVEETVTAVVVTVTSLGTVQMLVNPMLLPYELVWLELISFGNTISLEMKNCGCVWLTKNKKRIENDNSKGIANSFQTLEIAHQPPFGEFNFLY